MENRPVPEVFYGSAIAALCGLTFGLLLHTAWQNHPGGPRILFSAAEAAEVARPTADEAASDDGAQASEPAPAEVADLEERYVTPAPLPVTRLHPEMFDVQPAAADETQREDVDDAVADAAPQASPRDLD